LTAALALSVGGLGRAQAFRTLCNFNNPDSVNPYGGLIISSNVLYGVTTGTGPGDLPNLWTLGTVFKVNADGAGFTILHRFIGYYNDGVNPRGRLLLCGNTLYGTTLSSVFAVNTDGTGFRALHFFDQWFDYTNGWNAYSGLVLVGNTLYGTTSEGGRGGGIVYAINTNGSGFTRIHDFILTDGATNPQGGLVALGDKLYGTTIGPYNGAIFSLKTDGSEFTVLHTLSSTNNNSTNADGANPKADLFLSGNVLYGTTVFGGLRGAGTVFAINTDGTGFTTLHNFDPHSDSAFPGIGLDITGNTIYVSRNTLYGTASGGGRSGNGTIFTLNADGTGFTTVYEFSSTFPPDAPPDFTAGKNVDGAYPVNCLLLTSNTLYGTTVYGGTWGFGTAFSLSFLPQLSGCCSASNMVLSWPTNYFGFDTSGFILRSTTNLASPVWRTNFPTPLLVNGRYTVTNPITAAQQFFSLTGQ